MNNYTVKNKAISSFLALFRDETSTPTQCNLYVENISFFLAGAVSELLEASEVKIKTPLGTKKCSVIKESVVLVPVLRAGLSMLSGFQRILPNSETGLIWAHREENCDAIIDKYKFPKIIKDKTIILLDTMLATGGTINKCVELLEKENVKQIICASVLATQEGLNNLSPKIESVFFIDSSDELDINKYIFPGVGDSGDRLYG